MTDNNFNLILESISKTSSFVGARGEEHSTMAVVFQHGDQRTVVTQINEYDKRPFYDAWENREIKQVQLFQTDQVLWVLITIEEDAEWIGGPLTAYHLSQSTDQGLSWTDGNSVEWVNSQPSAVLLHSI